ncbi:MAG: phenylphosphate carboxylase subunit delta, partial [Candidatus Binatia bacterium]
GDDMVDLPILRKAGLAMTVRDGWTAMTEVVDYVTVSQGGRGAVREIVELLLRAQGKWGKMTQSYYS